MLFTTPRVLALISSVLLIHMAGAQDVSISDARDSIQTTCAAFTPAKIANREDLIPFHISARNSEGLDALIQIWIANDPDSVELAWYRSLYRTSRLLALGLFYSKYPDTDISAFPRFRNDAKRYDSEERNKRLEEIDYVEANREGFHKMIDVALKK